MHAMKPGDAISSLATPIARALKMPCIDPETRQLRPDSGCAKMRDNLNNGMTFTDAIYQRWFTAKQQGEKMKYQVSVVIEAEKLTEAAQKAESIGDVLSIQARPQPQVIPRVPITGQPK
jgi:hypothetical protein